MDQEVIAAGDEEDVAPLREDDQTLRDDPIALRAWCWSARR